MSECRSDTQNYDEDDELIALRELKKKLLNEVCTLRDKLKEEERRQELREYANLNNSRCESVKSLSNKNGTRLIEVSQRILGVSFEDVNRNWLQGDIYEYKTTVVTKALPIFIELKVDLKDKDYFEILDIYCQFPKNEVDTCYINEISPWIDMFIKMKNFSYLISAIANYSEQSVLRAKILSKLEKNNYVTLENCIEEGGGITVFVHSPKNSEKPYLKLQWATRYVDRTCRIEHFFVIVPADEESNFIKNNGDLLNNFCRSNLEKNELEGLWNDLCDSINNEDEELTS